jgi:hypothetical protein
VNERLQLALIVGCGFVIGLEAPNAARLVLESWSGPYGPSPRVVWVGEPAPRAVEAQVALASREIEPPPASTTKPRF